MYFRLKKNSYMKQKPFNTFLNRYIIVAEISLKRFILMTSE